MSKERNFEFILIGENSSYNKTIISNSKNREEYKTSVLKEGGTEDI